MPPTGEATEGLLLRMRKMEDLKPWGSIVYGPDSSKRGMSWNNASRRASVADARGNCCAAFAISDKSWSLVQRARSATTRSHCRARGRTVRPNRLLLRAGASRPRSAPRRGAPVVVEAAAVASTVPGSSPASDVAARRAARSARADKARASPSPARAGSRAETVRERGGAPTAAAEPGPRRNSSPGPRDFTAEPKRRRPDSSHILSGFAAHCHPSL